MCRPVGRGWARWARAHPTFGRSRLKYIGVPTQLLEGKGHRNSHFGVPTQLLNPTYGPVLYVIIVANLDLSNISTWHQTSVADSMVNSFVAKAI